MPISISVVLIWMPIEVLFFRIGTVTQCCNPSHWFGGSHGGLGHTRKTSLICAEDDQKKWGLTYQNLWFDWWGWFLDIQSTACLTENSMGSCGGVRFAAFLPFNVSGFLNSDLWITCWKCLDFVDMGDKFSFQEKPRCWLFEWQAFFSLWRLNPFIASEDSNPFAVFFWIHLNVEWGRIV